MNVIHGLIENKVKLAFNKESERLYKKKADIFTQRILDMQSSMDRYFRQSMNEMYAMEYLRKRSDE